MDESQFVSYEELWSMALHGGDYGVIFTGKELKELKPGSYTMHAKAKGDPKKGEGNFYLITINVEG